jgi:hypothetical protein
MEPEGTLPNLQEPASCPHPEPVQSSPCPHPTSWRYILMLSYRLRLGLTRSVFPSGFPTKTLHSPFLSPIRATCPTHLIILYLITLLIFGEEYRSVSRCSTGIHDVTWGLRGFRLPPQSRWDLRSSGLLRGVYWQFLTDMSGQHICPILKSQEMQEEFFFLRDALKPSY